MSAIRSEFRFAVRSLVRSPGFTGIVVLTLALAIGANTALISFLSPFLFRPLTFPRSEQLVHFYETDLKRRGEMGWDLVRQSGPTYQDWKDRLGSFQDLGAYQYGTANLSDRSGVPEQVDAGWVTPSLFHLLGVQPALGELFSPDGGRAGQQRRVLLGHGLWRSRYGGEEEIVGRKIDLNGESHVIAGVMPSDFHFPFASVRLWAPLPEEVLERARDRRGLMVVGRLKEGVGLPAAREELKSLHAALAEAHPDAYRDAGVRLVPLRQALVFFYDLFHLLGMVLLAALAAVLLVVCGNLANLILARTTKRRRELAVRQALGASRTRLGVRTLLESLLMALAAAALGLVLAQWCIYSVGSIIPQQIFRVGEVRLAGSTVLLTIFIAVAAGLIFGLFPALRAGGDLSTALNESGRATASVGSRRVTRLIVAAQTAAAMVLSAGALFAVYALDDLKRLDLGFDPQGLTVLSVNLPQSDYPAAQQVRDFQTSLLERLEALPGVRGAGLTRTVPLNFEEHDITYQLPGQSSADDAPTALVSRVSRGYFSAVGIPLLQGRGFESQDASGPPTIVISAALARRYWPASSPLGETLLLTSGGEQHKAAIIGVAGDSIGGIVFMERRDRIYLFFDRRPLNRFFVMLRSAQGGQGPPAGSLRGSVSELDPAVPVDVFTMQDLALQASRPVEVAALMLSGFAGFAMLLAALGIHGLVAYAASLMEKEIAIRVALGAERSRVFRLVLRQGLRGVLAGMATGLVLSGGLAAAAYAADPSQTSLLLVPLLVTGLVFSTALIAVAAPARRALRTDPIMALRAE